MYHAFERCDTMHPCLRSSHLCANWLSDHASDATDLSLPLANARHSTLYIVNRSWHREQHTLVQRIPGPHAAKLPKPAILKTDGCRVTNVRFRASTATVNSMNFQSTYSSVILQNSAANWAEAWLVSRPKMRVCVRGTLTGWEGPPRASGCCRIGTTHH